jgi:hypothetical protein
MSKTTIHPREFVGEIFIGGSKKATVLRAVTEDYLRRCGLGIKLDHGVDNISMAMSLVASMRGLALMPAYAKNLLPWSVVSRPLEGEAPTIDLAVGYSKANTSPILELFLSKLEELRARTPQKRIECLRSASLDADFRPSLRDRACTVVARPDERTHHRNFANPIADAHEWSVWVVTSRWRPCRPPAALPGHNQTAAAVHERPFIEAELSFGTAGRGHACRECRPKR